MVILKQMSIPGITENLSVEHFKVTNSGVYVKNNGNPGVLLIHATWCGYCKEFIPTYQRICKLLNKNPGAYPCVAIESEELKADGGKLSNALEVGGFPTIKFFDQNGKIIGNYTGSRDAETMLKKICNVYHHCVERH
jgi:protein disulfide-isomerase A6